MRHNFLYISFPFLHDYDVKMHNFAFCGERKQPTTKYISLSELGYGPLEFKFRRVRLHLANQVGRSNRAIKIERTQIHFFSDVLVAVASLDLKVPILCLKNETTILVLQNVQFESLLLAVRTFTVVTAFKKVAMNTSTHNFSLSPLRLKVLFFLLSRKNNLDRVSPYWQILSVVCTPAPEKPRDIDFILLVPKRV